MTFCWVYVYIGIKKLINNVSQYIKFCSSGTIVHLQNLLFVIYRVYVQPNNDKIHVHVYGQSVSKTTPYIHVCTVTEMYI